MWIARERIVPVAPRPAWLCFAGLGMAVGLLLAPLVYEGAYEVLRRGELTSFDVWSSPAPLATFMAAVAVGLSPLVMVAVLLLVTQRWGVVLAFSAAQFATMWLVLEGAKVLARSDGGVAVRSWLTLSLVGLAAIELAAYIAAATILLILTRYLVVRTVEHDPGDCGWCGYTRGAASIARCPECGRQAVPAQYRAHWLVVGVTGAARRGRLIGMVAILAMVGLATGPVWSRTIPTLRFYAAFPTADRVGVAAWRTSTSGPNAFGVGEVPGVWVPITRENHGGDRGLYVLFSTGAVGERKGMFLGVSGSPLVGLPVGSMRIHSELNEDQAWYVLNRGLPPALIEALIAAAEEVAWTPESAPRGQKYVHAAPYFPAVE